MRAKMFNLNKTLSTPYIFVKYELSINCKLNDIAFV